jgi:hypothetical protein
MHYSRRDFLSSMSLGAGSFLLTPLLQAVERQAKGDAKAFPSRFVFLNVNSGIWPEAIVPDEFKASGSDALNASLLNTSLPPSMKALEPYRKYLSIIQGLSGKMCQGGHTSNFGMLGVYYSQGEQSALSPLRATADAELAKLYSAPFNHVGLAVRSYWGSPAFGGTMYPGISAIGPGKELPFQGSPDLAFDQLFGSAVSAANDADKKFKLQKNLLDFMIDDIKKIEKAIPSSERIKLDAYLHSFEELQDRQSKLSGMKYKIKECAPQVTDKFTSQLEEVRQEAHCDLATAALIAGLTNCVTVRLDNAYTKYSGLGLGDKVVHSIGHDECPDGKTQSQCLDLIRKHHTELMATMAKKLMAVPEGNGTMLDNTMIIYLSDASNKHHGDCLEWPYVILGGCSGKLNIPGRYIRYPKYGDKGCRTIGDWWTTLLNAHGNPIKYYGNEDLVLKANGNSHAGHLTELIV